MHQRQTTDRAGAMGRRAFLRTIGAGAAMAAAPRWLRAARKSDKPNFIVVMADDLGAKELACYGHRKHRTPHLDALARGGVLFRTCYTAPICHPTRVMIMTGQYACHNKVHHFAGRRGGPKRGSPEENMTNHFTFAQMLKRAGYATALAGKWQLSGKVPTLVRETGFDEYCMWAYKHNLPPGVEHTGGWEGAKGGKTSRYWHPSIIQNARYRPTKPDDYGPDIFTDFVIDFATRNKDRPFFIYYPMALTHGPFYTTPDTTKGGDDHFRNDRQKNFQANVEYVDKLVGRIVAALEKLKLRGRTVVFFTGDNGTGGEGKGQPTELGARVPMIVNAPGIVQPAGATGELCDTSDVMPTLADFARAKLPTDRPIDGRSFAPLLRGEKSPGREWCFAFLGDRRILRTKRWLLEDNSPLHYGRLYDCGTSRDGTGYREVTDSRDPAVVGIKKRFDEILKKLPAPVLPTNGPLGGGKRRKRPGGQRRKKAKAQP